MGKKYRTRNRIVRRSKTRSAIAAGQRDYQTLQTVARPRLLGLVTQDRRLFYPGPHPIKTVADKPAKIIVKPHKQKKLPYQLAFKNPKTITLCVRRHRRRETLFALHRTGKGSHSPRRRRNEWSSLSC